MATTYSQAGEANLELLRSTIDRHHLRLDQVGVTVGLMEARNLDGPALKDRGREVLAVTRVNSLRDRAEGKPDATITIDAVEFAALPHERKVAILDRALTALELVVDEKAGGLKRDDLGRPKLKLRRPDYQTSGYWDVIDRHGKEAQESQDYQTLNKEFSQRCFPWG